MGRDLRKYARKTNIQLIAGAFFLLFVVGIGLIYFIYGSRAAVVGLLCLLAGLFPFILILGFLFLSDWIVKRARRK